MKMDEIQIKDIEGDRKPISEVVDKVQEKTEIDQLGSVPQGPTVEEMRALRNLSIMFGFDGDGFDGEASKAMSLYNWANENFGPKKGLEEIKKIIKKTGFQEKGKTLLKKVHLWISLEEGIRDLKERKKLLKE